MDALFDLPAILPGHPCRGFGRLQRRKVVNGTTRRQIVFGEALDLIADSVVVLRRILSLLEEGDEALSVVAELVLPPKPIDKLFGLYNVAPDGGVLAAALPTKRIIKRDAIKTK